MFVRGLKNANSSLTLPKNIKVYDFLGSNKLETILNKSELVLARSGYSTIMDLAVLGKKAFFIPTPGQTEQLYLAEHCSQQNIAPYCTQNSFNLKKMKQSKGYFDFKENVNEFDLKRFELFKSK